MKEFHNKELNEALHLNVLEGYEYQAIESAAETAGDDHGIVEEQLLLLLFKGRELDQGYKEEIPLSLAIYEETYEDALTIYDRESASMYAYHKLKHTNEEFAAIFLKRLADWDCARAQAILGKKMLEEEDKYTGRFWLYQATEKGYLKAERELGMDLIKDASDASFKSGIRHLRHAYDAGDEESRIVYLMSDIEYELKVSGFNDRISIDIDEIEEMAEGGLYKAYGYLGKLFCKTKELKNIDRAIHFYKKAAKYGYKDSIINLCSIFCGLIRDASDVDEKQSLCEEMYTYAKRGKDLGFREANFYYGFVCIELGKYDEALRIYERYERKDALASRQLGYMYQKGLGVAQSFDKAVSYYKKAMDKGLKTAEWDIAYAMLYLKKDPACIPIFEKGGKEGYSYCYDTLASIYDVGEIVERDESRSKYYKDLSRGVISQGLDTVLA